MSTRHWRPLVGSVALATAACASAPAPAPPVTEPCSEAPAPAEHVEAPTKPRVAVVLYLMAKDPFKSPREVTLACHCSHASISSMLLALGEEELQPVLKEFGKVDVTCEFCGRAHSYDTAQIKELLAAEHSTRDSSTKLN